MEKVLLYCPAMAGLAEAVAARHPETIRLGSIDWRRFQDGWPNVFIGDVASLRGRDVTYLAAFEQPADVLEQLGPIFALPRFAAGSLRVVLPYFATGTMERVDTEGQVATAKTLARMLSAIPACRPGGPAEIAIFDIHALGERFYFGDEVIPRLETAMPLLRAELDKLENVAVAFPDEGAWKRFHRQLDSYPHVICQKVRDGARRTVTIREGSAAGRHVVIVDDLVQTGETLDQCRRALVRHGAEEVSAYVTHAVFPDGTWQRFRRTPNVDVLSNFWVTDSCPSTVAAIGGAEPFRVLPLAGPIADIITNG